MTYLVKEWLSLLFLLLAVQLYVLKLGTNDTHSNTTLMLWSPLRPSYHLITNIIEITNSIQSATDIFCYYRFGQSVPFGAYFNTLISHSLLSYSKGNDTCLPIGYLSSLAITYNLYRQYLNHTNLSPWAQAWHYMDVILLGENSFATFIQNIEI